MSAMLTCVLTVNPMHLLTSLTQPATISQTMQPIGRRYMQNLNFTYDHLPGAVKKINVKR